MPPASAAPTGLTRRVSADQPRSIRGEATRRRADQIEQAALALLDNFTRQFVKPEVVNEVDDMIGGHAWHFPLTHE
jgi:UDP-2,3-diacylglucosamine pyrophosphatase LpxH